MPASWECQKSKNRCEVFAHLGEGQGLDREEVGSLHIGQRSSCERMEERISGTQENEKIRGAGNASCSWACLAHVTSEKSRQMKEKMSNNTEGNERKRANWPSWEQIWTTQIEQNELARRSSCSSKWR